MCSLKVRKYHRKIPVLESVFNKVAGLWACIFITKKFQHSCFPVKFAKFLRIPIMKNGCFCTFIITLIIIFTFNTFTTIRSSRSQMFCKIGILKNFANFTGKHLCWKSLFSKVADLKPADLKPATLLTGDSNTGLFLSNLYRAPLVAASVPL